MQLNPREREREFWTSFCFEQRVLTFEQVDMLFDKAELYIEMRDYYSTYIYIYVNNNNTHLNVEISDGGL